MKKIIFFIRNLKADIKWKIFEIWEYLNKHYLKILPKIENEPPDPPYFGICPKCGGNLVLCAVDTGEGYYFYWGCDDPKGDYCEGLGDGDPVSEQSLKGWWPYKFGVWVTYDYLISICHEVN